MARLHGTANALGFAVPGLLAWTLDPPASRATVPGIPFGAVQARWRVGEDLYEHTEAYDLVVRPRWNPLFRPGYRLYRLLARSVGQTEMPLDTERAEIAVRSRLVGLDRARDDRPGLRGCVRTWADDPGRSMHVAVYATHRFRGVPYMDVGFPLPGGSLSSVMRFDPLPDDGGALAVALTTRPLGRGEAGDGGIWFATRRCALRLPFQETIRVWAAGMAGGPPELAGAGPPTAVLARQELRMFGIRCLTLDYQLRMDGDLAA